VLCPVFQGGPGPDRDEPEKSRTIVCPAGI